MAAPIQKSVASPRAFMGLTPIVWGLVLAAAIGGYFLFLENAMAAGIIGVIGAGIGFKTCLVEPHFDTAVLGGTKLGHMRLRPRKAFWAFSGRHYEG
jgi:hypothetical protein